MSWLEASGQVWKIKAAVATAACAFIFLSIGVLAAFTRQKAVVGIALVMTILVGVVNLVLPLCVRCRVCGLQLETSSAARQLARGQRFEWIQSIAACPACGDGGQATDESRDKWRRSGRRGEGEYWSVRRIGLAILITVLAVGGGFVLGILEPFQQ